MVPAPASAPRSSLGSNASTAPFEPSEEDEEEEDQDSDSSCLETYVGMSRLLWQALVLVFVCFFFFFVCVCVHCSGKQGSSSRSLRLQLVSWFAGLALHMLV